MEMRITFGGRVPGKAKKSIPAAIRMRPRKRIAVVLLNLPTGLESRNEKERAPAQGRLRPKRGH